jgi:hypothetical protein
MAYKQKITKLPRNQYYLPPEHICFFSVTANQPKTAQSRQQAALDPSLARIPTWSLSPWVHINAFGIPIHEVKFERLGDLRVPKNVAF